MNDNALDKGIQEYIPKKIFITGGDESGEKATCQGDSGTMFCLVILCHVGSIITEILFFIFSGSPVVRTIQTSFKSSRFEIIGVVSWSKGEFLTILF